MEFNIENTAPTQAEIDAEKALILSVDKEIERREARVKTIALLVMVGIYVSSLVAWQYQLITGVFALLGALSGVHLVLCVLCGRLNINSSYVVGVTMYVIFVVLSLASFVLVFYGLFKSMEFFLGRTETIPLWPMIIILYTVMSWICLESISGLVRKWVIPVEHYDNLLMGYKLNPLAFKNNEDKYLELKRWAEENEDINKYFTALERRPLYGEYDAAKQLWVRLNRTEAKKTYEEAVQMGRGKNEQF